MDSGVVIWIGPVSTSNLSSVRLPSNWSIVTIAQEMVKPSQVGGVALTPTDFANYASTLGSDKLTSLMRRASNSPQRTIIAAFSAGAGLLDPLLQSNAGDDRILCVYSADAYYGLAVKQGYLTHAQACQKSGRPFWLSTSSTKGGVTVHSGSESMVPFADAAGLVATSVGPPSMPKPVVTRARGPVVWMDYQTKYSHVQHATALCPFALNGWFDQLQGAMPALEPLPEQSSQDEIQSDGPSIVSKAFWFLGAAASGYYGVRWLRRRLA